MPMRMQVDDAPVLEAFDRIEKFLEEKESDPVDEGWLREEIQEHFREQFEVEGQFESGDTGKFPENKPESSYGRHKMKKYGHLIPMLYSGRLKAAATTASMTRSTVSGGSEFLFEWSAVNPKTGEAYAEMYQSKEDWTGLRDLVVTEPKLEEIGAEILDRLVEGLEKAWAGN